MNQNGGGVDFFYIYPPIPPGRIGACRTSNFYNLYNYF